ncbi:PHD and RING finger domain-containing protein [Drosera capensis]
MGRGGRAGTKCKRRRNGRITDSENSDEDYIIEEDEDEQLDELDSIKPKPPVRRRAGTKGKCKRNVRSKATDSGNSDEDYLVEEDETDDLSDELDSLVGDDSEEEGNHGFVEEKDLDEEEEELEQEGHEEEQEEEVEAFVRSKARNGFLELRNNGNGMRRSSKRKRFIIEEDEEDLDILDEEEKSEEKDTKSEARKTDPGTRKIGREGTRKRRRGKYDVEEDDEDYEGSEDYNEDDEEFTPDEIDSLGEEEETPRIKEIKKRRKLQEKNKVSVKRQRQRGSMKVVKKSSRKKSKKRSTLSRKRNSGNDEDFIERDPAPRHKTKRKRPAQSNKNMNAGSDSDFLSYGPSDYEFTISEEEREQVKEANRICESLGSNLRTPKKIQDDLPICRRRSPCRKGKEKAEDMKIATKQVCGICLTEEGKSTVRGTLDCCSHFFCFACIVEWSKVETRCPLCKQRFMTISKPARCVTGIDLRDTVLHVPERNQVYLPSEDELRDYLDPYENVLCTECHQGGDDALMLLCDICDSPAHTYCVGLSREVPAGNWYCDGCRPAAALASANAQAQELTPDRRTTTDIACEQSMFENLADIDLNVSIPETPLSQENPGVSGFSPSPRYPGGSQMSSPVSGVGVSTLFGRRRIHRQIHNMLSTNRMGQLASRYSEVSTSDSSFPSWSHINRGVESTAPLNRSPEVGTSLPASCMGMRGYGPSYSGTGNDPFPGMINGNRERVVLAPNSTLDSVPNGLCWSRFRGTNPVLSRPVGYEPLRPCSSSRSSLAASTSSSSHDKEGELALMIRSHLRSVSGDMALSYNTFEEIAETSKNTILAVCGLENRGGTILGVEPPCCSHGEGLAGRQASMLRGCCSSCFDLFVGNVVRTVIDRKVSNWVYIRS